MRFIKPALILILSFYHMACLSELRYEISGVNQDAKDNITFFLEQLNPPQDANNKTFLKQVDNSIDNALAALGYYQVTFETEITGEEGDQRVNLQISPGQQTYITSIKLKIINEGKLDPAFIALAKNLSIKEGEVLNHGQYESSKEQLKSLAQQRGYFDAKYEKASVEVSSKTNSAVIYLWFDTGVRYQFGEIIFDTELASEKYIHSLQTFTAGDPFDFKELRTFNVEINKTGYYKNITILPLLDEKEGLQIPLQVIANNQPVDSFNIGLGYSTDVGVNGKLSWTRPWVNSQGHSIEADMSASNYQQEYSLTYKIPLAEPIYDYASIQMGYKVVDQNDTDTEQFLLTLGRHRRSSNNWLYSMFLEYDYETGSQGTQDFSQRSITPGVTFSKTISQGGINATRGLSRFASARIANKVWLSDSNFIKGYGKAKILRTYGSHQVIGAMELGAIGADSIEDIPSSLRFFTGGDQSVRGFSYESIAPEDDDGYLQGGLYLTVASLEYRYSLTDKWRIALFSDLGTATNDFSEQFSSSTGLGIVWSSPIGPIRFYAAKPLSDSADSLGFHFMIGPEL